MRNAKTLVRVERGRESCNLKDTAVLACIKGEISLLKGKLYIIYRELKVDFSHGDVSSGISNQRFEYSQMEASPVGNQLFLIFSKKLLHKKLL